jgi:hypothetical protein
MPEAILTEAQEAELVQHIFYGKLNNLPNLASKIVRIFTSSTFTGKLIYIPILNQCKSIHFQIQVWNVIHSCNIPIQNLKIIVEKNMA